MVLITLAIEAFVYMQVHQIPSYSHTDMERENRHLPHWVGTIVRLRNSRKL